MAETEPINEHGEVSEPANGRLPERILELLEPDKVKMLAMLIEAARGSVTASDEKADPCCLTKIRAVEKDLADTQTQLKAMIKAKEGEEVKLAKESEAHDGTKVKLERMTTAKNDREKELTKETKDHAGTKTRLEEMTTAKEGEEAKLTKETQDHAGTKVELKRMTTAKNDRETELKKETMDHAGTKTRLEEMTTVKEGEEAKLTKETQDHADTKAKLKEITEAKELAEAKLAEEIKEHELTRTFKRYGNGRFKDGYPKQLPNGRTMLNRHQRLELDGEVVDVKQKK